MKFIIGNDEELTAFLNTGDNYSGIKGDPPKGMTYEDGSLVLRQINVAWRNDITGEIIEIDWVPLVS